MTADPVCGATVSERDAVAASFYEGRVYLFCSEEHRDLFNTDPERLIDRVVDHYVNFHFRRPSVFVRHGQGEGPQVVG